MFGLFVRVAAGWRNRGVHQPRRSRSPSAATKHGAAVEQDRRGHGGRVRSVPGRGRDLHELRVVGCLRRGRRDPGRIRALRARNQCTRGASVDAAVVEAAYRTLSAYFLVVQSRQCGVHGARGLPARRLQSRHGRDPGRTACDARQGIAVGLAAANSIIALRTGDGRLTPIGTTSSFETKDPGPGVWRLTPPAFLVPQTPWLGSVQPFLLKSPGQFQPEPPIPLTSGVGPAVQRGQELRQRDERGSNLGSDRDGMVLYGKCDPAVQHGRP